MTQKTIEEFIECIKSKQHQASTKFQCGYQLALNDILYEAKKLLTGNESFTGNIKASKYIGVSNFKQEIEKL